MTSKVGAFASPIISLQRTWLLCRWCPAYRWRESDLGFYRELREPAVLMLREKRKREEPSSVRVLMQDAGAEQSVVAMRSL
jgi:hypothetical protein